jgi:hypothetical protein
MSSLPKTSIARGDDLRGRIGIHRVSRDVYEVAAEHVQLGCAAA